VRPLAAENIYKIYAESFRGEDHLSRILEEAQAIVGDTLAAAPDPKEMV
jgi:phosphoglucomutase